MSIVISESPDGMLPFKGTERRWLVKRYFTVTLAFLVLTSMGCASSAKTARVHQGGPGYRVMPQVFWENGEATVTVKQTDSGLGTGAVFRKDGYIITNWHVVAPSLMKRISPDGTIEVVRSSGTFEVCQMKGALETCSPAELVKSDPKRDLAILKSNRRFTHEIAFTDDTGLQPFDFVYNWANVSVILPVSPFRGRYVNRIPSGKIGMPIELLVIDLSANPGGSGSPVFDRTGKCIGIAVGVTALKGAPLEIVIPSREVVDFLAESGFKVMLTPSESASVPPRGK